jgi:hypothetical protein
MSKSRDIADSAATINYIDNVTSDVQSQIDTATSDIATNTSDIATKAPLSNPTFTGTVTATSFSGDGSGLTGVDSLPSQTGNSGLFLTTDGTDASWGEAGGGAWTLLSTVTASAASTADVETTFDSTYDTYVIVASGVTVSTSTVAFRCRLKLGGAYNTSSLYHYHVTDTDPGSAAYSAIVGAAQSSILMAQSPNNGTTASIDFRLFLSNPEDTTTFKRVKFEGAFLNAGQSPEKMDGVGHVKDVVTALTGVRFYPDSGTLSGTFRLYGINNS